MMNRTQDLLRLFKSKRFGSFILFGIVGITFVGGIVLPRFSHAGFKQRTYKVVADAYVEQGTPNQAFGRLLHIEARDNDTVITLLRFDVEGLDHQTVTDATLRLSVMNGSSLANIRVFATNNNWSERAVTWETRPALGTQIAELPIDPIKSEHWIEIPLGQAITGNNSYSFALTTDSRDRIAFRSRSTSSAPELVLQLQGASDEPELTPEPLAVPETLGKATFVPKQLHMDAPEIVNPLRGLYRWMGQEYAPQPTPARDAYGRYTWRELEPTQGDYRFVVLEADIAKAAREGRKFSFRVRTVVSGRDSSIPDYGMDDAGWWADYDNDGSRDTYVPDWNAPAFLRRVETFMQALGTRYDGDPRIAFIDIGLYGNWGEWHMANFSYPSDSGAQRATAATKQRLIDMHIAAFPTTPLVMMTDDAGALVYAMQRSPRIGWRRDALGWDTGHFGQIERDPVRWNAIKDRWKTALVVTEFANPRYQSDPQVFQQALQEVQRYHVSLVSNANTIKWASLSEGGKQAFLQLGKTAGYRLELQALTLPNILTTGITIPLTTRWANNGVAPVYEPWQVYIQLRSSKRDEVVWETTSAINLTKLLPGSPIDQYDTATLPKDVAPGVYDIVIVVADPRETRAPLALALADMQPDGSYHLGTIHVQ